MFHCCNSQVRFEIYSNSNKQIATWQYKYKYKITKIIFRSILHFSAGSQIFYAGGLIFYRDPTGTKACVTAADLIVLDGNIHCFMLPSSSCNIKISVVSQCRILMPVYYMKKPQLNFFQLTTCNNNKNLNLWTAQWLDHCWRRLTKTERADWQQTHKSGNTNTNLKLTQTAATQYTGCTLPTNSTLLAAAVMLQPSQNSCRHCCHLMTIPCTKTATYEISKQLPNQNSRCKPLNVERFIRHKLKIINKCISCLDMPWKWKVCSVLHNYKWNKYFITMCNRSGVARKDSSIMWRAIVV